MKITLRPYQEKTKKEAQDFLYNSSYSRGIIVKPTGSGKAIDTAIISQLTNENCLVVQPSYELLMQNLEKARFFGMEPSVFSASAKSKDISKLTYATPLSIVKNPELFKGFDVVIIDEAHENMTVSLKGGKTDKKSQFIQFLEQINPRKVIGLTATPITLATTRAGSELRMINRTKRSYWNQADIFSVTQVTDIKDKYWANLDFKVIDSKSEMLRLNSTGNDFTKESIIKSYEENDYSEIILEQYEKLISEGKKSILTFVPTVKEGKYLRMRNRDFEFVYDKTPTKEREAIIKAFKRGDIPNLISVETMTTGFDFPELDSIIMARETNSFALYSQIIGRIVRPIILPDGSIFKKTGTVVDLTGNYKRFGTVEDITFEKQDYTKGWAMWNGDKIMTGHPFKDWNMPTREDIKKTYHSLQKTASQKTTEKPTLTFGKHKGKTIEETFKKDKGYLSWLLNNKDFKWETPNMIKLKKEIDNIFKKEIINN